MPIRSHKPVIYIGAVKDKDEILKRISKECGDLDLRIIGFEETYCDGCGAALIVAPLEPIIESVDELYCPKCSPEFGFVGIRRNDGSDLIN